MRTNRGQISQPYRQAPRKGGCPPIRAFSAEFLGGASRLIGWQSTNLEIVAATGRVTQELVATTAECLVRGLTLLPGSSAAENFAENLAFLQGRSRGILEFLQQRFVSERMGQPNKPPQSFNALEKNFLLILSIDYARQNPAWIDLMLSRLGIEANPAQYYAPMVAFLKCCTEHIQAHLNEETTWPDVRDAENFRAKEKSLHQFAEAFDQALCSHLKKYCDRKDLPDFLDLGAKWMQGETSAVSLKMFDGVIGVAAGFMGALGLGFFSDFQNYGLAILGCMALGFTTKFFLFPSRKIKRLNRILVHLQKIIAGGHSPKLAMEHLDYIDLQVQWGSEGIRVHHFPEGPDSVQQPALEFLKKAPYYFQGILASSFVEGVNHSTRVFFNSQTGRIFGMDLFGRRIFADQQEELAAAFAKIEVKKIWKGKLP